MQGFIRTLDDRTGREVLRPVEVVDSSMPTNIVIGQPTTVRVCGHDVPLAEVNRAYAAAHGHTPPTAGTVTLSDGRGGTYEMPAADAARYRRGPTHGAPAFDDDAQNDDARDELPAASRGADARWNAAVTSVQREQGIDAREAAKVVQMRDPNLYHQRREELAGMRLPKSGPRRNRHVISDYQ